MNARNILYFLFAFVILLGYNWRSVKEMVPETRYLKAGMGIESEEGPRALNLLNPDLLTQPVEEVSSSLLTENSRVKASDAASNWGNTYRGPSFDELNGGHNYWDGKKVQDQLKTFDAPPKPILAVSFRPGELDNRSENLSQFVVHRVCGNSF